MQTITPELADLLVSKFQAAASGFAGRIEVASVSYRCRRMAIDKSLRLQSDQMEVEFANEDGALGWGTTSVFPTNSRIRAFQWFGDVANEVQVFDGLIDNPKDHRDIRQLTLTCRDRFALLIDQTFSASAPQAAGEAGAVRTAANGVYVSMEASDIFSDILDRAGWPTADRAITPTSYVLDEFVVEDGASWADTVIGDDRLTGLTGYDAWSDELGIAHFAPTPASDIVTVDVEPVYTWQSGVDLISLDDSTDQYELRTRFKTRGPLSTLKDAWTEKWRTSKFKKPVGLWYDPSAPTILRVLDRGTKRMYKLRQSDRVVLSSVYLGGIVPHPLGLSGDPSDSSIYWVLNCPWIDGGGTSGNTVKKIRKSDNVLLASYAIPNGRWSAIKVSAAHVWLTNLDTDRFYSRSKTTLAAVANYQHVVGGVTQANPSGLMIDGTTLHLFWANGGTTARFVKCDESAPATETGIVKTTGTALHGGEMDTTTHVDCYGDSDSLGLVAKFSLVVPTTTDISVEVIDGDLEDELGALAELENRIHDSHPGDAAHPWEARRGTVNLTLISSLAQANDTARFWVDKMGRRRRVVDAGIIGNPAIQKSDLVRVEDPVSGVAQNFIIDTYRSEMSADGTFVGTVALIRGGVANESITQDPPATDPDGVGGADSDHFWAGSFDLYGESGSGADGEGWSSPNGKVLAPSTAYRYHFEWSQDGNLYAQRIGIGSAYAYQAPGHILFLEMESTWGSGGSGTVEGTFSTPDTTHFDYTNVQYVVISGAAGDHLHHTDGTFSFWIDPL